MVTRTKKHGSVVPVPNATTSTAGDALNAAQRGPVPKGMTQKKAFEKLIPYFFVLRSKGCSWGQITKLLKDECGFKLQSRTVQNYFSEMAPTQIDICQKALTEHLLALAEIRKKSNLGDMAEIS